MEPLFHIARASDWRQAQADGAYRVSTLGVPLAVAGFIHLSFAAQVKPVADAVYRDEAELLLLRLDPAKLTAPVVIEPGAGTDERFPHLYGELDLAAVDAADPYRPAADGRFPPVIPPPTGEDP